jgi:formylglycine-generating enzyme required for sulfatase activity
MEGGRFAMIPAGCFWMGADDGAGDERPRHRVWIAGFEMAVYPVTEEEYAAFRRATGHEAPRDWRLDAGRAGRPPAVAPGDERDLPVTGVSWHDARAYCAWRTAAGDPLRLPTEAEWERAARGGLENARFSWGNELPDWLPEGGRGSLAGPWPVTLGPPNGFGLHGIGANVHEWCADWYDADYYAVSPDRDPSGPRTGTRRVSRGGAWRHAVTISRCAARSRIDPAFRYTDYGFRVIRNAR